MWISEYRSPWNRIEPEVQARRSHTDEDVSEIVIRMLLGKDWTLAEASEGRILLRQYPPHHAWEWEFTRLDA